MSGRGGRLWLRCAMCDAEFSVIISAYRLHGRRFCSQECFGLSTRKPKVEREPHPLRPCGVCGKDHRPSWPSQLCSDECRTKLSQIRFDARRGIDRAPRICPECGNSFTPVYGSRLRLFCSADCSYRNGKRTARAKGKRKKIAVSVESVNPQKVFERDGWLCHLCGKPTSRSRRGTMHPLAPELDHVLPLSKGGDHSYANTACAHRKCNALKGSMAVGQPSLLTYCLSAKGAWAKLPNIPSTLSAMCSRGDFLVWRC